MCDGSVLQLNKHGGKILSTGSYLFSIRTYKTPEHFAFHYSKNKMNKKSICISTPNILQASSQYTD